MLESFVYITRRLCIRSDSQTIVLLENIGKKQQCEFEERVSGSTGTRVYKGLNAQENDMTHRTSIKPDVKNHLTVRKGIKIWKRRY